MATIANRVRNNLPSPNCHIVTRILACPNFHTQACDRWLTALLRPCLRYYIVWTISETMHTAGRHFELQPHMYRPYEAPPCYELHRYRFVQKQWNRQSFEFHRLHLHHRKTMTDSCSLWEIWNVVRAICPAQNDSTYARLKKASFRPKGTCSQANLIEWQHFAGPVESPMPHIQADAWNIGFGLSPAGPRWILQNKQSLHWNMVLRSLSNVCVAVVWKIWKHWHTSYSTKGSATFWKPISLWNVVCHLVKLHRPPMNLPAAPSWSELQHRRRSNFSSKVQAIGHRLHRSVVACPRNTPNLACFYQLSYNRHLRLIAQWRQKQRQLRKVWHTGRCFCKLYGKQRLRAITVKIFASWHLAPMANSVKHLWPCMRRSCLHLQDPSEDSTSTAHRCQVLTLASHSLGRHWKEICYNNVAINASTCSSPSSKWSLLAKITSESTAWQKPSVLVRRPETCGSMWFPPHQPSGHNIRYAQHALLGTPKMELYWWGRCVIASCRQHFCSHYVLLKHAVDIFRKAYRPPCTRTETTTSLRGIFSGILAAHAALLFNSTEHPRDIVVSHERWRQLDQQVELHRQRERPPQSQPHWTVATTATETTTKT